MDDPTSYRLDDGVAVITLDDGKANAVSHGVLDALDGLLDRAGSEARAIVITGREGRFSAGFDLAAMTESNESMRALVSRGARFLMRLYGFELPTVAGCTGHALAAGALMLLSCDVRIGSDAPCKIGLNEVAIGMPLPVFAVELARQRMGAAHFGPSTMGAQVYDPAGAAQAGYLDRVVGADQVLSTAIEEARRLGQLRSGAYARTKRVARAATIAHILDTLDDDMSEMDGPSV